MSKQLGVGSWVLGAHANEEGLIAVIVKHHPLVTDGWMIRAEMWGDYLDPRAKTELQTIKEWPQDTSSWRTTLRLFGGNPDKKDRKLQREYIAWMFSEDVHW